MSELMELIEDQSADTEGDDEPYPEEQTSEERSGVGNVERHVERIISSGGPDVARNNQGMSSKPIEKANRCAVGEKFYSAESEDDPATDSGEGQTTGRFYRPNEDVAGMVYDGHGFRTESLSNPDVPRVCLICGAWINLPNPGLACEFGEMGVCYVGGYKTLIPVGARPCECNPCTINQDGKRGPGRPAKTCSAPKCKRSLKARQKRNERRRKLCRV